MKDEGEATELLAAVWTREQNGKVNPEITQHRLESRMSRAADFLRAASYASISANIAVRSSVKSASTGLASTVSVSVWTVGCIPGR